ncbi:MAG: ATP-binding protein [Bacteroidales bacterium]
MMINRTLTNQIIEAFDLNKVILIWGARRVGKTTLVKSVIENLPDSRYINCELLQNREALETSNSEILGAFLGQYKYLVLDEAQTIRNIGSILKIIHDTFPEKKIIATGSSSFHLHQQSGEPLTGRSREFIMTALSFEEVVDHEDLLTAKAKTESILRFGLYPEIYSKSEDFAIDELENIASNYLFKDILQFENLKRPDVLYQLVRALAFQTGSEVSYNELSNKIGVHVNTVKRYIELLEQNYVIFRLPALSNNPRNEIGKSQKIYFYDCGIRNAVIRNFNPLGFRNDTGQLWENFVVSERMKIAFNHKRYVNTYFWRNYQKKEIDYIEEQNGNYMLFECKYSAGKKLSVPKDFDAHYTNYAFHVVNRDNYWKYLMG